jgi:hypothetical protein
MDEDLIRLLQDSWRKVAEGDGGKCPCCRRWGKVYGRNINETMCRSLIWLAYAPANEMGWVNVPENAPRWVVRSNQLATLRWWGLVERLPSEKKEQKHSGMWRVTQLGKDFIERRAKVPKTAFTYAGEVEHMSSTEIAVEDCFGKHFNYEEVMGSNLHYAKHIGV